MMKLKGQPITFNGQEAPVKNEKDFQAVLINEQGTYCVVFNSDVVVYKKSVTFNREDADTLCDKLLADAVDNWNKAETLSDKNRLGLLALTIAVNPLRIH